MSARTAGLTPSPTQMTPTVTANLDTPAPEANAFRIVLLMPHLTLRVCAFARVEKYFSTVNASCQSTAQPDLHSIQPATHACAITETKTSSMVSVNLVETTVCGTRTNAFATLDSS